MEIITSTQARPAAQWLDFVVSSKARSSIDIEIKRYSGDRARIVEKGAQLILEAFKLAHIPLDEDMNDLGGYVGYTLSKKKIEELCYQIGQGIIKPSSLLPRRKPQKKIYTQSKISEPTKVIVGGQKDIPHQLAQCCAPAFPTDILAVLRTGGKCMIHSTHCRSLDRANPSRILGAYWHVGEK